MPGASRGNRLAPQGMCRMRLQRHFNAWSRNSAAHARLHRKQRRPLPLRGSVPFACPYGRKTTVNSGTTHHTRPPKEAGVCAGQSHIAHPSAVASQAESASSILVTRSRNRPQASGLGVVCCLVSGRGRSGPSCMSEPKPSVWGAGPRCSPYCVRVAVQVELCHQAWGSPTGFGGGSRSVDTALCRAVASQPRGPAPCRSVSMTSVACASGSWAAGSLSAPGLLRASLRRA